MIDSEGSSEKRPIYTFLMTIALMGAMLYLVYAFIYYIVVPTTIIGMDYSLLGTPFDLTTWYFADWWFYNDAVCGSLDSPSHETNVYLKSCVIDK